MKFVVAVIKPERLESVRKGLDSKGVQGMTVTEVRGFGRQKGYTEIYRGAEHKVEFIPKLRIEVAVSDKIVDETVKAIREQALTDEIGDGKIFVLDLKQAVRIRTNEKGDKAL